MKWWGLPLFALLAAAFGAWSVVRSYPRRPATEPPAPPPTSPFTHTIAAVGLIEASSENVAVATPLSGVVAAVHVRVGETVARQAPLFELDTRHLRAEREARAAALAAAESRARTAATLREDQQDQLRRAERLADTSVISADELIRRQFAERTARARWEEAQAEVANAQAALRVLDTELERSVIRSPLAGEVLRVNVRPGEFAAAGAPSTPLLVLGQLHPLHVRVEVDEHEGWRVRPDASAVGQLRGASPVQVPLKFVRFEPLVVPKRSLTGDVTERVDTRVLQVIYEAAPQTNQVWFVGQQVDVFIDGGGAAWPERKK